MTTYAATEARGLTGEEKRVIYGASLGTLFEWYDFLIYGSLAPVLGQQFFAGVNPTAAFLFALLAFSAGFAIRPLGAIFFGRLGDLMGRKFTFLITMAMMGVSTALVGFLPNYASIGITAPILLIALRLIQGLAMGGEYGGAATYIAEHAPPNKRGAHTAWIQTTATLGLLLALLVILISRSMIDAAAFNDWGWRIPFLLSVILLGVSIWIRMRLQESPMFERMKREGRQSSAPIMESFGRWNNLRVVLLALALAAGPGIIWAMGQFYVLFFLTQTLKVDPTVVTWLLALALIITTPFFIIFGRLSDRIGRKPIILAGCLLAALTYFPLFQALTHFANPALEAAQAKAPVVVAADPADCSLQFNPVGVAKFTSSCDVAKSALVGRGVPYSNVAAPAGTAAQIKVGETAIASYDATAADALTKAPAFAKSLGDSLQAAGYPAKADPDQVNKTMILVILVVMMLYVTIVYGPLAALLVELFPTRIRYTSFSLPYHLGSGIFGGFVPPIAFAIVAKTGNLYDGIWYAVIFVGATFLIGLAFAKETRNVDLDS